MLLRQLKTLVAQLWAIRRDLEQALGKLDPGNPARALISQAGCELERVVGAVEALTRRPSSSGGGSDGAAGLGSARGPGVGR
jgi:hypothetical protein